jgi:hypothetical protein
VNAASAKLEALRRLDPSRPALEEEYVARSFDGAPRGWPWPERLRLLLDAGGRPRVLLHGAVGSGKTSELLRWKRALEPAYACRMVLVGGGLQLEDVFDAIQTTLRSDVHDRLSSGFANARHRRGERSAIPRDAWFEVMAAVYNDSVEARRPLVLLIDGTDRVRDEAAPLLFGPGSPLTRPELPPMICTAPNALLATDPNVSRDAGFDVPLHLPPFPVVDAEGKTDVAAVRWLALGLERRLHGLDLMEEETLLERVARSSAGIPRDAVRILRAAVLAALDAPKVQARHVIEGEREVRQDLEQALQPSDLKALRRVEETSHYFGASRLVTAGAVVAYEGRERRYWRAHPLLADLIRNNFHALHGTLA